MIPKVDKRVRVSIIPEGDKGFLRQIINRFHLKKLGLEVSSSKQKHPDIWLEYRQGIPVIVVTQEWAKQDVHSRRSRLIHEILHIKGLEHGKYDGLEYSTYPDKDTYSGVVYRELLRTL